VYNLSINYKVILSSDPDSVLKDRVDAIIKDTRMEMEKAAGESKFSNIMVGSNIYIARTIKIHG
jgi:hypothetical protein